MFVFGVFLAHIFPHSDWIQNDTPYLSEFRPNARKYWPDKIKYGHLHSDSIYSMLIIVIVSWCWIYGGLSAAFQLRTVEKRGWAGGRQAPHHFVEQKCFFHTKSENIKFLHVSYMWDFSLFIEQDVSDKK